MGFRSTAGKRFDGAPLKPEKTASLPILLASRASGRQAGIAALGLRQPQDMGDPPRSMM
jgi:hypothetical protein